jgi:hypothetical protein
VSVVALPPADPGLRIRLAELRRRADEDFLVPPAVRTPGRHQLDVSELGLRVALTRARYPNRRGGADMYAVTVSRLALDHAPAEPEVRAVLDAAFGEAALEAAERTGGGPLIRMFRVPAGAAARPQPGPAGSDGAGA